MYGSGPSSCRHAGDLEAECYGSGGWSLEHRIDLLQHISRHDVIEPEIVRVIGSV